LAYLIGLALADRQPQSGVRYFDILNVEGDKLGPA
jgi:hypothetical protein